VNRKTLRNRFVAVTAALGLLSYGAIYWLGTYVQSDQANCVSQKRDALYTVEGLIFELTAQRCGFLYGGPYVLISVRQTGPIASVFPAKDIFRVETDSEQWNPTFYVNQKTISLVTPPPKTTVLRERVFSRDVKIE
jgi:hypothetical protein